jgi:hypothetical protein
MAGDTHPEERIDSTPELKAQFQNQALFATCASSATAALPTAFFLPEALEKPSPTASSTAISVKPFFTAFLTVFSTFFAAFFFALSFAIFPHNHYCRRAAFFTAFLAGFFLVATFFAAFFTVEFLPAVLVTVFLMAFRGRCFLCSLLDGRFFGNLLDRSFRRRYPLRVDSFEQTLGDRVLDDISSSHLQLLLRSATDMRTVPHPAAQPDQQNVCKRRSERPPPAGSPLVE